MEVAEAVPVFIPLKRLTSGGIVNPAIGPKMLEETVRYGGNADVLPLPPGPVGPEGPAGPGTPVEVK
jgi:hypothetical protein